MQSQIIFYPLITYNPTTQGFDLHDQELRNLGILNNHGNGNVCGYSYGQKQLAWHAKNKIKDKEIGGKNGGIGFIGVFEMKNKDYKLLKFGQTKPSASKHGLYISTAITSPQAPKASPQKTHYLLLPPNQQKIPQKYQDLLAGIALTLSSLNIFDISSKYLRQNKNSTNNHSNNSGSNTERQKNNYVLMGTGSYGMSGGCGEIYKAAFLPQGGGSKMEISTKLSQEYGDIMKEFLSNLSSDQSHCQQFSLHEIISQLSKIAHGEYLLKNYLTFQQLLYTFISNIKIFQYLHHTSNPQYSKLTKQHEMLSLTQLDQLEKQIDKFVKGLVGDGGGTVEQGIVIQKCKEEFVRELRARNGELRDDFLIGLKKQYFQQVSSLNQLYLKKQLSQKILQEYGISPLHSTLLYSQTQTKIQNAELRKLSTLLAQKQKKIKDLTTIVAIHSQTIQKNKELIKNYEQKAMDFKQLNLHYIQKCQQLAQSHSENTKSRQQISQLHLEQKRQQKIQQDLYNFIHQLQTRKEQQQKIITSLHGDIREKEECIKQLGIKLGQYQTKIVGYRNLEAQAWGSIEEASRARDELGRYKDLVRKLEEHFQVFKKNQIQKFNYVLARNLQHHKKLKRQLQQKISIITDLETKLQSQAGQLQQERARLKFVQENAWSLVKNGHGNGNGRHGTSVSIGGGGGAHGNSRSQCQEDRKMANNRSFVSAV